MENQGLQVEKVHRRNKSVAEQVERFKIDHQANLKQMLN
jgi:hypothetical protein